MSDFVIKNDALEKYTGKGGEVLIPEGVKQIKKSVFKGKEEVKNVIIPDSVQVIGEEAFSGSGITELVVPEGVKKIGACAFASCQSLKRIVLPSSLQDLGRDAFSYCAELKDISVNPGNKIYIAKNGCLIQRERRWYPDDKVISVLILCTGNVIAEGIDEIGWGAFREREDLTEVVIPEGVKRVDSGAFIDCNYLESVIFPRSLTRFSYDAFYNCERLTLTFPECYDMSKKQEADEWEYHIESYGISDRDAARILIFQTGTKWDVLKKKLKADPDKTAAAMAKEIEILPKLAKAQGVNAVDYVSAHHDQISAVSANMLYTAMLKKNKTVAALLAEDPVIAGMLSADTADKKKSDFILEDKMIVGVSGKGKKLTLPDHVQLKAQALSSAEYETIVVSPKNDGVTAEWLQKASLSDRIQTINIPFEILLKLMEGQALTPFSADIGKKLNIIGTPKKKDDSVRLIQLIGVCLNRSVVEAYDQYGTSLDQEGAFEALRVALPEIDWKRFSTAEAIAGISFEEEEKCILCEIGKVLFGGILPDRIPCSGNLATVPTEVMIRMLVDLAINRMVESDIVKAIGLIDRNALADYLWQFYTVYTHDPYTKNIVPLIWMIGQIGFEKQVSSMVSDYKEIERRAGYCFADGVERSRVGYAIRNSVVLNDDYAVLLMLDKRGMLLEAANVRGIKLVTLRNMLLNATDNLLDSNAQLQLDSGSRSFTAMLMPDMTLSICCDQTGKISKTLPKCGKSDDVQKAEKAQQIFKELKSNIKNISAQRAKTVQEMLQTGSSDAYSEWKATFMGSVILRRLSAGVLWGVYDKKDQLLQPFSVDMDGKCFGANEESIELKAGDLIGVVDAAQLSEEALVAWRTFFWKKGTKAIIRQFEAPARYVPAQYVEKRYMELTLGVGYARNVLGYDPYSDDAGAILEGSFISLFAIHQYKHQAEGELTVDEIKIRKSMPNFADMTDHQKRLLNRDLIRLDSVLHPEKKVAEIVATGSQAEVKSLTDTHLITPDNITQMLGVAIDKKNTDAVSYLLELKQEWLGDVNDPFAEFTLD